MIKQTPYYHRLESLGATFRNRGGFATIDYLTSIEDEHRAVRERVGMFDVYYQVAVEVKGRDAERVLARALVNDVRRLPDGGVLYSSICTEAGGMVDDLTCFRFNGSRFWLSPSPSRVTAVVEALESLLENCHATITNLGYANAYLSIQGPKSRDLLSRLADLDLTTEALPYFHFTRGAVAGVADVIISRTGYSGELGYELFYPVEYAEHLWDAVQRTGAMDDIRVCGMKTMRSLRIEKMYLIYGLDLTTVTDPISAGLGWTIRFDDREFAGRAALERIAAQGSPSRLCLLDTGSGFHPLAHGDPVVVDGERLSTVTSADPGFTLRRSFALAYLPSGVATAGREVFIEVDGGRTRVSARVSLEAPYDPRRQRLSA